MRDAYSIDSPLHFLQMVFSGCDGLIEIRPIGPNGPTGIKFFKDRAQAEAYGLSLDGQANVYYGVGTRIRESGTKQDVQQFFSYFDPPVDVGSIKLVVR